MVLTVAAQETKQKHESQTIVTSMQSCR